MNHTPRRRSRRGALSFSDMMFAAVVLSGLYGVYLVVPPFMESLEVKEATANALFQWNDKGQKRGIEIYEHEIYKRELNPELVDKCTWYELRMQKERYVECAWEVPLHTPWGSLIHTMEFYVHRGIDRDGGVFDVEYYE